jgi:hypothetical protein
LQKQAKTKAAEKAGANKVAEDAKTAAAEEVTLHPET